MIDKECAQKVPRACTNEPSSSPMPGMHAGELLYRMQKSEACGLLGEGLTSLLAQGNCQQRDTAMSSWNRMHSLVSSANSQLHKTVDGDLQRLAITQRLIRMRISSKVQAIRGVMRHNQEASLAGLRDLDRRIVSLVMQYTGVLEEERREALERLQAENHKCDADLELAGLVRDLNIYGLHLEYETQGKIQLRRLSASHPQSVRCHRAATENLKPSFFDFDPSCPYNGVNVLEVFKVENTHGLEKFQTAAADIRSGKVKGLFCEVPRECLEHLIVHGFSTDAREAKDMFKESWFQVPRPSTAPALQGRKLPFPSGTSTHGRRQNEGAGYASLLAKTARPVDFPRDFSRYSTFEAAKADILRDAEARAAGSVPLDSRLRVLVLCRVLMGRIYVSGEHMDQAVKDLRSKAGESFDCLYSSADEEYRLLNPTYVLPEFLMLYRYTAKGTDKEGGASTPAANSSQALQTAHVNGEKGDSQAPPCSRLRASAFPLACYGPDLAKSIPNHHQWPFSQPGPQGGGPRKARAHRPSSDPSGSVVPPPPPSSRRHVAEKPTPEQDKRWTSAGNEGTKLAIVREVESAFEIFHRQLEACREQETKMLTAQREETPSSEGEN